MAARAIPPPEESRLIRGLRVATRIGAIGYLTLYVVLVALRVRYPFELEWLEGASVDHVRTILSGRPLYGPPSLDFVPLTYTPLFFYLGALLSKIVGVGFLPLRLISIVSSFLLLFVIFRIVVRETQDRDAGLLAAGLFAATFGWTGGWLDLARTDCLFLLIVFIAIYVLRWSTSARSAALAGALVALAFLAKQTGVVVAVPLALICATRGWRPVVAFGAVVVASVVGTTMLFDRITDDWYFYYIYLVPRQHPVSVQSVVGFWRYDLMRPFGIALVGSLAYLVWKLRRGERSVAIFYGLAGAGLFGGAWLSRLHSLSFVNVVLPAYAAVAVVFPMAVHELVGRAKRTRSGKPSAMVPLLLMLSLAQLAALVYSPVSFVPTARDVRTGQELLRHMAATPGRIFVPYHGYLPALIGRETNANATPLADVIRGGVTDVELGLARRLDEALRTHYYDAVFGLETPTPVRHWLPIDTYYRPDETVVSETSRFWRREIRLVPR